MCGIAGVHAYDRSARDVERSELVVMAEHMKRRGPDGSGIWVAGDGRTAILFEAPGRLATTLGDLLEVCGPDRLVVVARELTKLHEEVWRGSLAQASAAFSAREVRGEVVVVLAGDPGAGAAPDDVEVADALGRRLEAGDTLRDAATTVAGELAVSRRRAYDLALELRRNAKP